MDEPIKLPPQTPPENPEAKPQHKELKPYRRCYEVNADGSIRLFWLSPTNEESPIAPFGANMERLRKIGYKTKEEWWASQ